jgi:aspartyl-tRNA(Asn)/glutamyl-tRNA(Gln) amidotransferase subunit B
MSSIYDKYEAVIGLEVHTQLLTTTKAFSSDMNEYGSAPNSNVSVISLGHPGTLPKMNKKAVEFAIRLGLATECDIRRDMHFARKNYFYADLPKGYQISQDKTPICTQGKITISPKGQADKVIGITRIHMEEDSGKSIHDQDPFDTLIDLNRAGVPLLEIVSEPDMRTSEEAYAYLAEVRRLVKYLEICDGNLEEGSMRCDANISVRLKGTEKFGTKVEVKNMNSLRNVQRAIEFEIKRQIDCIESGQEIFQETRNFDAATGTTSAMRSKEMAHDYRYFPEPDLPPVVLKEEDIERVRQGLPPLPRFLIQKYTEKLGLSEYDAQVLTEDKQIALYFEDLIQSCKNYKTAANWVTVDIKSYLNKEAITIEQFPLKPETIAQLISLIDEGKVSHSIASQKIFPLLIAAPNQTPLSIAESNNWIQESDDSALEELAKQAIAKYPDKVEEYKSGKKGLLGLFMGEVMKLSQGKADPKKASKLVAELLEN